MRRRQGRRAGGQEAAEQGAQGGESGHGYLLSFSHGDRLESRHLHPRSGNNPSLLDLISQSGCLGGPAVRWLRGQTSVHPAKGQGRGDHTGRQGQKGTAGPPANGPLTPRPGPSARAWGCGEALWRVHSVLGASGPGLPSADAGGNRESLASLSGAPCT